MKSYDDRIWVIYCLPSYFFLGGAKLANKNKYK